MLVSVVIGALNEENYIGKTLATLKAQKTSHKFELVVGDGYSEDKTVSIAKKAGARVAKEKNRSAAWERNAGAKIAKGEIIAFTDADAQVPPEWVEIIAREFESDKGLAMLYGPVSFSDSPSLEKSLSTIAMKIFLSVCAFAGFHNPIGSNIAVRRDLFEKAGMFDTSHITAEDLDLGKRMAKFGKLKYAPGMVLDVSPRRVKKWGYPRFVIYHMINALRFHLTGASRKDYAPVR